MNRNISANYHVFFARIFFFLVIPSMFVSGCMSMAPKQTSVNCPPVDASSLRGSFNGTWEGIVLNSEKVSGEFSITIAPDGKITGTYTGSISGNINGCIDTKGNIQASGTVSGGIIAWIGSAGISSGNLSAKGTWIFGSGSGTWSGQR